MIYKHSAGGVLIDDGKVLVLSWIDRDFICLPKGGIEEGETSEITTLREVKEETGYNAEIIKSLGSWCYDFTEEGVHIRKEVDYYLMRRVDNDTPSPSRTEKEHFENVWLNFNDALKRLTYDDAKEALTIAIRLLQNTQH